MTAIKTTRRNAIILYSNKQTPILFIVNYLMYIIIKKNEGKYP